MQRGEGDIQFQVYLMPKANPLSTIHAAHVLLTRIKTQKLQHNMYKNTQVKNKNNALY